MQVHGLVTIIIEPASAGVLEALDETLLRRGPFNWTGPVTRSNILNMSTLTLCLPCLCVFTLSGPSGSTTRVSAQLSQPTAINVIKNRMASVDIDDDDHHCRSSSSLVPGPWSPRSCIWTTHMQVDTALAIWFIANNQTSPDHANTETLDLGPTGKYWPPPPPLVII